MSTEYFEDIKLHQKCRSGGYHLNEKDIIDFAKEYNLPPFHIDPEFAKNTKFGGVFAAGIHPVTICVKLVNKRRPRRDRIATLGWDKVRFVSPAWPGDALVFEMEAISKRESNSAPNAGIVRYAVTLLNQRDKPVFTGEQT